MIPQASQDQVINIGEGTRGRGAGPSQYFTLETLLIFIHAAQIAVCYVWLQNVS